MFKAIGKQYNRPHLTDGQQLSCAKRVPRSRPTTPCGSPKVQLGGGCRPCRNAQLGGQSGGADAWAFPLQLPRQATQHIPRPHLA